MTAHEDENSLGMYTDEKAEADAKYWGGLCRQENSALREQYLTVLAAISSKIFPSSHGGYVVRGNIPLSNSLAAIDHSRRYAGNTLNIDPDIASVEDGKERTHRGEVAHLLMMGAKFKMFDQLHLFLEQAHNQGLQQYFDNLDVILHRYVLEELSYPYNLISIRDKTHQAHITLFNMVVQTILECVSDEYIVDTYRNRIRVDSETPGRDFHNMAGSYIFVSALVNPSYSSTWQDVIAVTERKGVDRELRDSARAIVRFADIFRQRMHEIYEAIYDPESNQILAQAIFTIIDGIPNIAIKPLLLSICQNYSNIYALGHRLYDQSHPFSNIFLDTIYDILEDEEDKEPELHIPNDDDIDRFFSKTSVEPLRPLQSLDIRKMAKVILQLDLHNHLVHVRPELLPDLLEGTGISIPSLLAFSEDHDHIACNITLNSDENDQDGSLYVDIFEGRSPFVNIQCLPSERAKELTKSLEIVIERIAQDPKKYLTTQEHENQRHRAQQRLQGMNDRRKPKLQSELIDQGAPNTMQVASPKEKSPHERDEELSTALSDVRDIFARRKNQPLAKLPSLQEISERSTIQHKLHFTDDPKGLLASVSDGLSRDEISEVYERIQGYTGYGSVPGVEYKTFTLKESRTVFHELKFRIHDGVPIRAFLRQIGSKQGEIFFEFIKVVRRKDVNLRGKHKRLQYL